MFTFQDTRTPTTLDKVTEVVDQHTAVIGNLVSAPVTYRRLTRTGLRRPRTRLTVAAVLGIAAAAQATQRTLVLRDTVALDADSTPGWHTDRMLPLRVRPTTDQFGAAKAYLGRTADGPVVVFDERLLKIGSYTDQVAAYRKAVEVELSTRPQVAVAVFTASYGTARLLRHTMLGAEQAPVSGRRAAAYLVADLARTAVAGAATRALKRASVNRHL